ncbi:MAG: threonine/serine dehydratase [Alphaproteobacteria bacterium]|nr:threonine/serine dehydratase [Alphaproteobacteria bacterium]|tara:strand:+ start:20180 stop:21223 length:1044 start_codon:yes stop_codon:yes gene_type:complete
MERPEDIRGDLPSLPHLEDQVSLAFLAKKSREALVDLRRRTRASPLVKSQALSRLTGAEVLLKCDQMLPTGAFKFRGAFNKLTSLQEAQRKMGVMTASTGNHGLAVATVAAELGISATIHASEQASRAKLDAIRALGAEIVLHAADPLTIELEARRISECTGQVFVSPYNDLDVIAGQGTCGLEIIDEAPIDAVVLSVGGGGLLCGVGAALRTECPNAELMAVWPENAPSLFHSMKAGRAVEVEEFPTIADATAGGVEPGSVTISLASKIAPNTSLVSEQGIAAAMVLLAREERLIVEGSAALAVAGLMSRGQSLAGKTVAVILCGRNISYEKFEQAFLADKGSIIC